VVAIDGSPVGSGRTATLPRAMAGTGALSVAGDGIGAVVEAVEQADAVVFGSPVYRASCAHPLKHLLDELPRGMWGKTRAPLQGKAVCIVATAASLHHFLALDDPRSVLAGFFAAHVVPPGLYVPRDAPVPARVERAGRAHRDRGRDAVPRRRGFEQIALAARTRRRVVPGS
jgi:FMN reductase